MNPYGVNTSDSNIRGPLVSLTVLYESMPKTSGCENCKEVNGNNEHWCCLTLNPSMYYAEFLLVWEKVQNWSKKDRLDLIGRCISNYLDNSPSKGCVFYKNGCQIYLDRPLACRVYAVISDEGWQERINLGKKRFGENYNPKPQCNLVKSEIPVSLEMENKWFKHTQTAETRIGVNKQIIQAHDDATGSYRTFHDHILIELFDIAFLNKLSGLRLTNMNKESIESFVNTIKNMMN